MQTPTKTFGITTPADLFNKLVHDIRRLDAGLFSTAEMRYAAFDCAIASWHLVDWVLRSVDAEHKDRICPPGKGPENVRFLSANETRMPYLRHCQQIANTGKHLVLTYLTDDPNLHTGTSVRFHPPFDAGRPDTWKDVKASAAAYVIIEGWRIGAIEFFARVAEDWQHFLVEEGLMVALPVEPNNVFA